MKSQGENHRNRSAEEAPLQQRSLLLGKARSPKMLSRTSDSPRSILKMTTTKLECDSAPPKGDELAADTISKELNYNRSGTFCLWVFHRDLSSAWICPADLAR